MTDTLVLTPPEPLVAPQTVQPVPTEKAGGMVPLEQTTMEELESRAGTFIAGIMDSGVQDQVFQEKIMMVHNLGMQAMRDSASVSNRMLNRPITSLEGGIFDERSPIADGLVQLRMTVEDLNPKNQGDLLAPSKLLGIIPWGNQLRKYFLKYESAQKHINAIINQLLMGQDVLRKDNAALEEEKATLWATMQTMQQYVYLGKQIDEKLEERIAEIAVRDSEKARVVKEEILFSVRQKVQDLLTQLAVSIQGYLALDMIRKNNLELIKGVDRATTTTIAALRTAVIVAQALANQKLVLDQINALQATTGNIIEATSEMLKQQTADIHKQAINTTINMEQLQHAFDNIYTTMDMISTYKIEALDTMKATVTTLSAEVQKANTYIDRVQNQANRSSAVQFKEPMHELDL